MRIFVPVNRLDGCKSRLAPVLNEQQRAAFTLAMLEDVLDALADAFPDESVELLSADDTIAGLGARRGLQVHVDDADDINAALNHAVSGGSDSGPVLVVPADVPTATADDFRELVGRHVGGVTLVKASEDGGTNALLVDSSCGLPFSFGPDSFNVHRRSAERLGVPVNAVDCPGLQRDMDRPEDLRWLVQQEMECRARQFLWDLLPRGVAGELKRVV